MTQIRHADPFPSGLTATGFWLGLTIGRFTLGFVTPKIGERLAIIIYILCGIGLELLFWLVPQFIVSAVAIALVGFFIGPFWPAVMVMATKLLPKELHVASIGFSSALGGGGAAVYAYVLLISLLPATLCPNLIFYSRPYSSDATLPCPVVQRKRSIRLTSLGCLSWLVLLSKQGALKRYNLSF